MLDDPRQLRRSMFDAAVAAALPARVVGTHLPQAPPGRTVVVGAGKASAAMAKAVEDTWPGPLEGLVVTRYGHAVSCGRIEIVQADYPVPDEAGGKAAERILSFVQGLGPDDLVIALISGGGSSLLSLPAPGLTLSDKQAVNRALLVSGAHIGEMNGVRKHLSAIKGGRLATAAFPAPIVTLLSRTCLETTSRPSPPGRPYPTRRPTQKPGQSWPNMASASRKASYVTWSGGLLAARLRRPNPMTRSSPAPARSRSQPLRCRSKPPPRWRAPPGSRRSSWATALRRDRHANPSVMAA